jgi:hypothetical protein
MVFPWKAEILDELLGGDRQLRVNFFGCGAFHRFFEQARLESVASKHPHSQFVQQRLNLTDAGSYSGDEVTE